MPYTAKEFAQLQGQSNNLLIFMAIVGLSLIPTSFIMFVVKEKETGCKGQQLIAGVSPAA
jgi:ATP-binding cassette subfamily A (ABC1) protein 3